MGDQNTILTDAEARHLLRRATFDGSPASLVRSRIAGLTRGAAVDKLLPRVPSKYRPIGRYIEQVQAKWIENIARGNTSLQSKLVLFWHDHFATAYSKVGDVKMMQNHVKLLYTHSLGNFRSFVKVIGKDPAMIEFLDTERNRKRVPNENYARELMELFTFGVVDFAGQVNYLQEDIVQIARAFTGWSHENYKPVFHDYQHDYDAQYLALRGPKVLFKGTHGFPGAGASFTVGGEGEPEADAVIDILFQHRDTDGHNTVARRIAKRLLEYYAYADPETSVVDGVVAAAGFDASFDIRALLRAIFAHDAFYATAQPSPFPSGTRKSVKWPAHYFAGAVRMLKMKLRGAHPYVDGGSYSSADEHMGNMGQTLLDPPSVFGWDWETSWLSSATLLARYQLVRDLVAARYGSARFRPEKLIDIGLTDPVAIVDAVIDILDVGHQISTSERSMLLDYLTDGGSAPSIDLQDEQVRNVKLHGLFALVMQSPAFQVC
jgi:uncharacterized protein (DUF1800 family)